MKIALINLINYTVDVPKSFRDLFGLTATKKIQCDKNTSIVELGIALSNLGHDVIIYISDAYQPEISHKKENLQIKYLPTKLNFLFPPAFIPFCPSLFKELYRQNFDVIQTVDFFQSGTIMSLILSLIKKTKVVIWQDLNNYPRFPGNLIVKLYNFSLGLIFLNRIKMIIPKSDSAKRFLLECKIYHHKIYHVIPSGVNSHQFLPLKEADLEDLNIKKANNKFVLSVARLHPQKGLEYLIPTMQEVVKEVPNVVLLIKGDGIEYERLQNIITKLSLEPFVLIIRANFDRDKLVKLYNFCEFTVLSSIYETIGFVVLESLSCEKPVIVTDINGPREIVSGNDVGYIVKPRSSKELAKAIVKLLKNDAERSRMGMNGRKLILAEYDWEIIADQFVAAYASDF